MKWYRFFLVLVCLAVAGCISPTGPRYPQPDEDDGSGTDPDKAGMVMTLEATLWA